MFSLATMLLSGVLSPSTTFAQEKNSAPISVRTMQRVASMLFGELPKDTITTAFEFTEVLQNDSRQRQVFLGQVSEFFVEVGQGKNMHVAANNLIQKQPLLAEWQKEQGDNNDPRLIIIIIIIIIILLLISTPAY